jgi:hypothetical protein
MIESFLDEVKKVPALGYVGHFYQLQIINDCQTQSFSIFSLRGLARIVKTELSVESSPFLCCVIKYRYSFKQPLSHADQR